MPQSITLTCGSVPGLRFFTTARSLVVEIEPEVSPADKHLALLPTLQDLKERLRAKDPDHEEHLATSRHRRYLQLLEEVEANRLSRLTAERLRLRLTQAELAEMVGMAQSNISRLEKPRAVMRISTAERLAKALELDDYRVLLP
jgi:ribosome-binding protein aMBF1 (putative translation factor)